jgi:hypothetical protein
MKEEQQTGEIHRTLLLATLLLGKVIIFLQVSNKVDILLLFC